MNFHSNIESLQSNGDLSFVFENNVNATNDMIESTNLILKNFPNPFNPSTTISFSIPFPGQVDITIYNIKGQKVKTLTQTKYSSGLHSFIWNGNDEKGKHLVSGVYL